MKRTPWICSIWLLVLLSYVLPYTLLANVTAWYGSFLLWTLVGLLVIILNIFVTKGLGDSEE